jgi:transposase
MLALSSSTRYFIYGEPTDMRFGINSQSGLVRNGLGFDPMNGDVFLFLGKRSNQVRLLQWDREGFAMYVKKLERGTFERPRLAGNAITSSRLTLLLQGVKLESISYRKRYDPSKGGQKQRAFSSYKVPKCPQKVIFPLIFRSWKTRGRTTESATKKPC